MKSVFYCLVILLLAGCASTALSPEAQSVEMKPIGPAEEGRKCTFIQQIQESKWMGTKEAVENQLRNTAAKLGGNYVHVLKIHLPGESMFGDANVYKCDTSKK